MLWALSQLSGVPAQAQTPAAGQSDGQPDGQQLGNRERARLAQQKGRALDQKGDLPGALQQLREAANLDGENATILAELGALALRSKDLAQAEAATQKAIPLISDPRLLASVQYTLGRIYEERGDKPKALEAFLESLRTRPTPEARIHAEPLIPEAQPPVMKTMTSVASHESFCQNARATSCPDQPSRIDDSRFTGEVSARVPAKAPYKDVQLWFTSCQDGSDSQSSYTLAVRLASGWFIAADVLTGKNRQRTMSEQRLKELTLRPLSGTGTTARAPLISWRSLETVVAYDRAQSRETTVEFDQLILASIGPSGTPSYSEPLRLGTAVSSSLTADDADGRGSAARRAELSYKLLPDGQLELVAATKQTKLDLMLVDEELVTNLGRQRLVFP